MITPNIKQLNIKNQSLMKNFLLISLALLVIVNCQANSPALKASFSYELINQIQSELIAPNLESILEAAMPTTYSFTHKIPIIGNIKLDLSNIELHKFSVDWSDSSLLAPNGENQFSVILKDVSIALSAHYDADILHIANSGDTVISIDNFSATLTIGQQKDKNSENYGLVIADSKFHIDDIKIHFSDKYLEIATDIISHLIGHLGLDLFSDVAQALVKDIISPKIFDLSVKGFSYVLNGEVEFLATLQNLFVNSDGFGTQAVNLNVIDLINNAQPSLAPVTDMPNSFPDGTQVQLFMSQNVFDQLVWGVFLAEDIGITLSKLPPSVPFALNTSQMAILVPEILTEFGPNLGMYLNLTDSNSVNNIVIRDGRIVGIVGFLIDMWVDVLSTDYPQQGFANCIEQGNCKQAVGMNTSLFLALDLYNINQTYIGVDVMNIAVANLLVTYGGADKADLQNVLNDLLGSVIPMVNQEVGGGIKNPLIGKYGISAMDIDIETDYIRLGLGFDI